MSEISKVCCKSCKSESIVKNGIVRGHQRYRCKSCRYNFTQTPKLGVPAALKSLALVLYGLCGMSMNKIGKIFGVSNVAVLKWVRKEGQKIKDPVPHAQSGIVMLDELWHFVGAKKKKSGSGGPLTAYHVVLSDGNWVVVVTPAVNV